MCFVAVGVTQILWRPRGLLVDQFDSREDLINAVFTSSFIPGYAVVCVYFLYNTGPMQSTEIGTDDSCIRGL